MKLAKIVSVFKIGNCVGDCVGVCVGDEVGGHVVFWVGVKGVGGIVVVVLVKDVGVGHDVCVGVSFCGDGHDACVGVSFCGCCW